jgi:hypothetical protein
MSSPIFFKVLAKSRLRPLPPSMSTQVSCEAATTGSRTNGDFLSSEKLVHLSSVEKVIRTLLYLRGFCMAGSTERISRRVSFYAGLEGKPPSLPKMLMAFFGSLKS